MFSEAISSISSRWRPSSLGDRAGDLRVAVGERCGEEAAARRGRLSWPGLLRRMSRVRSHSAKPARQGIRESPAASRASARPRPGSRRRRLSSQAARARVPAGADAGVAREPRLGPQHASTSSPAPSSSPQAARERLIARHGQAPVEAADVIVALGGDGLMLVDAARDRGARRAGLRHEPRHGRLPDERLSTRTGCAERLAAAEEAVINPLRMVRDRRGRSEVEALAINEVSILRAGPQAAKLRILVDGRERMAELVADGALVCTPGGLDGLQLFRPRPDPADRGRHPGADADGGVPAAALARRAAAEVGAGRRSRCWSRTSARSRRWPTASRCATPVRIAIESVPDIVAPHPVRPRPRAGGAADPRTVRLTRAAGLARGPALGHLGAFRRRSGHGDLDQAAAAVLGHRPRAVRAVHVAARRDAAAVHRRRRDRLPARSAGRPAGAAGAEPDDGDRGHHPRA